MGVGAQGLQGRGGTPGRRRASAEPPTHTRAASLVASWGVRGDSQQGWTERAALDWLHSKREPHAFGKQHGKMEAAQITALRQLGSNPGSAAHCETRGLQHVLCGFVVRVNKRAVTSCELVPGTQRSPHSR